MGFWGNLLGGKKLGSETSPEERTVFNLRLGDIVTYEITDFEVTSKSVYDEDGYRWTTYGLRDAEKRLWLTVEVDDETEISMFEEVRLKLGERVPSSIAFEGERFDLDEKGRARVATMTTDQPDQDRQVAFWDFSADSGTLLAVEQWGSELEVFRGKRIQEHELTIFPGS
ncbi:MAG: DUF4178 domain-containing protein [Candidatus Schekmanbacteria bacterium]|nr:DUF4178 domain-containing protein [Candidatus Schekmanbacteria bacterium]